MTYNSRRYELQSPVHDPLCEPYLIVNPPKEGFWHNVWSALQRAIALIIFKGVHLALEYVLKWHTPPDMETAFRLFEDGLSVVFMLVYAYLCYEMVTVYIPWLRRRELR